MKKINNNLLTIRNEIKRLIKTRIENGDLRVGQIVPSVRDLSSFLNVNRNTVAQAYQELTEEEVLYTVPGAGTFVGANEAMVDRKELYKIIDEAVKKAEELGFHADDIIDAFFNLVKPSFDFSNKTILVVECNEPTIGHICSEINAKLNIHTEGLLLQELEKNPTAYTERLTSCEMVVCGFNHAEDLIRMFPNIDDKIATVLLQTDINVLDAMMEVPDHTTVGYVCVNQYSAETFYNSTLFSGHKRLNRIISGLNNTECLNRIMAECNIVFVTNFAYELHSFKTRSGQQIIKVEISLEPNAMNSIKERMMWNVRKRQNRRDPKQKSI